MNEHLSFALGIRCCTSFLMQVLACALTAHAVVCLQGRPLKSHKEGFAFQIENTNNGSLLQHSNCGDLRLWLG